MPKTLKRLDGFSLIEVLVVVAIIGLVVGIAVPALGNARDKAKATSVDANVRTLNGAMTRAKLDGVDDPVLHGTDATAAALFLIRQGYIEVRK